jgi:hypothetical protein
MRWLRKRRRLTVLAPAALVVGTLTVTGTLAAFTSQADNPSNSVTAASDFRAPPVTAQVVSKTQAGSPAYIKQGGTYYLYATVGADIGNPATGISSVTADASNLTTGQTTVAMASGSWTVAGTTYNYRTASLTANAVLSAGSKAFSVTATDGNSNSATGNGTVTVDNTAPTGSDVQATNTSGLTVGKAEVGDTLTYTFSEPIEPDSILTGWTGSAQAVTARLVNGASDSVEIWNAGNTAQLGLGSVALIGNYAGATRTFPSSTMTMVGNTVTVVLGTPSGGTNKVNAPGGAMTWTPATTTMDRAANAGSAAPATEATPLDPEF